jgi:hypothetical protein
MTSDQLTRIATLAFWFLLIVLTFAVGLHYLALFLALINVWHLTKRPDSDPR